MNGQPEPLVSPGRGRQSGLSNEGAIKRLRDEIRRIERSATLDKSYIPQYQRQIEELQKEAGQ